MESTVGALRTLSDGSSALRMGSMRGVGAGSAHSSVFGTVANILGDGAPTRIGRTV